MPSFEIPDGPTTISLKSETVKGQMTRTGTATFSVTNKTGQPLAGRLSVQPQGNAKADWFPILGEKERTFAANETQKITVNVNVPPGAVLGEYKFRLRVVNVNDPDNDYTDSPVSTFNIAAPPPVKEGGIPPWVYVIIAVVILLIVGGVVGWLALKPSTTEQVAVPDVVGHTFAEAKKTLTDAGLVAAKGQDVPGDKPGNVASENPTKGTQVDKGSTVTLDIISGKKVPDVRGKTFDAAKQKLEDEGFDVADTPVNGTPTGAKPGTVIAENPDVGSEAGSGVKIALTVDPGVKVPDLVNSMQENIGNSLKDFSVTVSIRRELGTIGQIVALDPSAGTVVEKGHALNVTVRGFLCRPPLFCIPYHKVPWAQFRSNSAQMLHLSPIHQP